MGDDRQLWDGHKPLVVGDIVILQDPSKKPTPHLTSAYGQECVVIELIRTSECVVLWSESYLFSNGLFVAPVYMCYPPPSEKREQIERMLAIANQIVPNARVIVDCEHLYNLGFRLIDPPETKCPDGLLPDGENCPRCGERRGPSGVDGGSWVHY